MLLNIYDRLPGWLGINDVGDLVGAIICFIITLFLYIVLGGAICPKRIKNRFFRVIIILGWPVYLVLAFFSLPIIALVDFSKPWKQQEQELSEFMEKLNDEQEKW